MARALEVILILHMDHEQNASTSTVRVAGGHCFYFSALAVHVHLALVCSTLGSEPPAAMRAA